jgi:hypothetical protein
MKWTVSEKADISLLLFYVKYTKEKAHQYWVLKGRGGGGGAQFLEWQFYFKIPFLQKVMCKNTVLIFDSAGPKFLIAWELFIWLIYD